MTSRFRSFHPCVAPFCCFWTAVRQNTMVAKVERRKVIASHHLANSNKRRYLGHATSKKPMFSQPAPSTKASTPEVSSTSPNSQLESLQPMGLLEHSVPKPEQTTQCLVFYTRPQILESCVLATEPELYYASVG